MPGYRLFIACLVSAAMLAPTAPVAGPASAAPPAADGRAAGVGYTPADVGFAEGHGLVDGDLARRLDGMVAYLPGRSPMVRVDLNWWYVQECRTCGPLFLFSYRDACISSTDPECNFGVVDRNFTEKDILFPDLRAALSEHWRPVLESGQTMRRWVSMLSDVVAGYPHRYQLWLQDDGNLVLYQQYGPAYWATGTRDGVALVNRPDGNLVLLRADGSVAWSTGTSGNGPARLIMQHDGNLVLYRVSDARPIWASNTVRARSRVPADA
ncbi:hypothetical protein [Plantactinospora sp. BC1]|uniref:hypothetical protein n=1 Tax=Plantactinospora sp. BC1 TaxID=2108470 RepID=UPI00131EF6F6|nr:hypothetical protein [Plantactinospora sp. BC1]